MTKKEKTLFAKVTSLVVVAILVTATLTHEIMTTDRFASGDCFTYEKQSAGASVFYIGKMSYEYSRPDYRFLNFNDEYYSIEYENKALIDSEASRIDCDIAYAIARTRTRTKK